MKKIPIESEAYLIFYDVLLTTFVKTEFGDIPYYGRSITGPKNWTFKGKKEKTFRVINLFNVVNHRYFYLEQQKALELANYKIYLDRTPLILALLYIEAEGNPNFNKGITYYSESKAQQLWDKFKEKYLHGMKLKPPDPPQIVVNGLFSGNIEQGKCTDYGAVRFIGKTSKKLTGFMKVWYEQDHTNTPINEEFILKLIFINDTHFTVSYSNKNAHEKGNGAIHFELSEDGNILKGNFIGYFSKRPSPKRGDISGVLTLHRTSQLPAIYASEFLH